MFRKRTSCRLMIAGAMFISLTFTAPVVWSAPCGDGIKPCACGDTVENHRALVSGVDPIVGTTCGGDGLIMNAAGVTLDLNGNKLRGSGSGVGVLIEVDNVTIIDGQIFSFGTGISTATTTMGSTIDHIRPDSNTGDGIFVRGDNNELTAIPAKSNGNHGVVVIGNGNRLERHNDEYNGFDGIHVEGDDNRLIANLASENAAAKTGSGNGITVIGNSNTLDRNKITKLNIDGIAVLGDNNTLIQNRATKQKGDGITVDGDGNVLTDNTTTANRGVGIIVVGAGNPAASAGNSVSVNRGRPQCSIYGVTTPPTCIEN
jgi:hypothetical protein